MGYAFRAAHQTLASVLWGDSTPVLGEGDFTVKLVKSCNFTTMKIMPKIPHRAKLFNARTKVLKILKFIFNEKIYSPPLKDDF